MPITYTVESRGAEWSAKTQRGKTTGLVVHQVRTSEPTTPLDIVWNAPSLPTEGSDYPGTTDGELPCTDVEARPLDQTRMFFRVESNYDSTNTFEENPLLAPTAFSYATESSSESYFEDETAPKKALARHTNNIPFTELPKRDNDLDVITITKNVAANTTNATLKALRRKVNIAPMTIDGVSYPAGQLRVTSTSLSDVKTQNGTQYRTQTVVAKVNPNGWDQVFESMGLLELTDGHEYPIVDADGVPVTQPWPLTADGAKAATRATKGAPITLKPYKAAALTGII